MVQSLILIFDFDLTDLIVDFNKKINLRCVFLNLIILSKKFVLYKSTKKMILVFGNFKRYEKNNEN